MGQMVNLISHAQLYITQEHEYNETKLKIEEIFQIKHITFLSFLL